MIVFHSILANEMSNFLKLYTNSSYGTQIHYQYFLISLDSFLAKYSIVDDTAFQEWAKTIFESDYQNKTKISKIMMVNSFIKYLHATTSHKLKQIPVPKDRKTYLPYIYSDNEIRQIITYLDDMKYNYDSEIKHVKIELPILFRLYIYTGMRRDEALNIKLEDYDDINGTIVLRKTKGMKERFIPLNNELNKIVKLYKNYIIKHSKQYLFPGTNDTNHITGNSLHYFFLSMREQIGFGPSKLKKHERGACIHCFRHYFAIHAFKKAQDEGRSIDTSIPYLSYYLGHQDFGRTEEYLKFTPDMFPDETSKFENFADDLMEDIL